MQLARLCHNRRVLVTRVKKKTRILPMHLSPFVLHVASMPIKSATRPATQNTRIAKSKRVSAKQTIDDVLQGKRASDGKERCIPKQSFRRLVHEITQNRHSDLRFQLEGVDVLQEAAELLVIERFQKCARLAELCRKDTVQGDHWSYVSEEL